MVTKQILREEFVEGWQRPMVRLMVVSYMSNTGLDGQGSEDGSIVRSGQCSEPNWLAKTVAGHLR
jgi:hypothetical protein